MNTLGQFFQELHTLGFLRCFHYFFVRCVQPAKPDIFQQRGVEQVLILRHIGDVTVQRLQTHITKFLAANGDAAFLRVIIMDQQFG